MPCRPNDAAMELLVRVIKVVSNGAVPYDRRVWLEATTLAQAGHDVTVICPRDESAPEKRVQLEGVSIERYWLPFEGNSAPGLVLEFLWSLVAVTYRLLRLRRTGPIDVLHVANPPETFWSIARVLQRSGTSFVFDHHDLSPEMYIAKGGKADGVIHRALRWMERQSLNTADLVISTNDSYAQLATERGDVPADRVAVVRSAPDFSRWEITARDPTVANGRDFVVGFLGEMGDQDGIEHLLDAAAIVRRSRDDVQYVLVGDGPHQSKLEEYARVNELEDCVTFTGRRLGLELCHIMSSMDIGVAPDPITDWSRNSTINKIMDYMFFSMPIVSYALKESMVSAGEESALFVRGETPDALAAGIEELLDDPDLRTRMGQAGRARVQKHLGWNKSAIALLEAYGRLEATGLEETDSAMDGE
jgi:glycosyltransferase involved in cell wall biosynthesis